MVWGEMKKKVFGCLEKNEDDVYILIEYRVIVVTHRKKPNIFR